MMSWFSRLIDHGVNCQFKKDPSGRLVFIPFSLRKKVYFVDSKSDEVKLRALVKMYRSALQLISWMTFPGIFIPGLILEDYAGLTPKQHRLTIALGIPLFFWLVLAALAWILWGLYKQAVPSFTASLTEVGPDLKSQLSNFSQRPRLLVLVLVGAGLILLGVALFAAVAHR